jgi:hypothetical protein
LIHLCVMIEAFKGSLQFVSSSTNFCFCVVALPLFIKINVKNTNYRIYTIYTLCSLSPAAMYRVIQYCLS